VDHGVIHSGAPKKKEDSPMAQYYVGLDVHSRQSTFVIEDGAGRVAAQREVPTTPAGLAHRRTQSPPPVLASGGTSDLRTHACGLLPHAAGDRS
jgi:hypothetical protein